MVSIDPLFADAADLRLYQVFVTPWSDDTSGLAVINRTASSFEVVELASGKGDFAFDWRIDAPRNNVAPRLAPAPDRPRRRYCDQRHLLAEALGK